MRNLVKKKESLFGVDVQKLLIFLTGFLLFTSVLIPKDKKDSVLINFKSAMNSKIGDRILAQVGSNKITVREFLASYEFGPAFPKRMPNSKKHFLDFMINEKLLALYGYSKGINDSSQVKDLLEAIKGDLVTDEMFNDDILKKIKIKNSELDSAAAYKQINYRIKWLYSPDKNVISTYEMELKKGSPFDSLFDLQFRGSVFADERSMETDRFKLKVRNPEMLNIIDRMKIGEVSEPKKENDGWYIFKLDNIWKNMIITQSELAKEKTDAEETLKKEKMDRESDIYVDNMLKSERPVIIGSSFAVVRSYLGGFELQKDKYDSWNLDERLREVINKLKIGENDLGKLILITLKDTTFNVDDFINWYRLRSQYIKLNKEDFNKFSASIESNIWQMVRDNLLMKRAYARGYQDKEIVKQQLKWWQDKIVYAVMRDKIASSVKLNSDENKSQSLPKPDEKKDREVTKKILHEVIALKQKYKIEINEDLLNKIYVEDSDNPKTLEIYFVKKGGIYPHPAYPTIDMLWQNWQ